MPTSDDAFTFVTPGTGSGSTLPVVRSIFPKAGPVTGGTTVYVLGHRFTKAFHRGVWNDACGECHG